MEALAWVCAFASLVGYAVALHVGPSCASSVGPWAAGAFFASFFWVAYLQERKKGGRR